ncbi:SET domain-containing protein isoform X2 [Tasmannia lanceolata]|uniref:SET domain-containing protein isoform X2 n=1 Tax=Tasmannia lanceolata TaxID=3420 RepID=UPI004063B728
MASRATDSQVKIKEKLESNGENLELHTSQLFASAVSKKDLCSTEQKGTRNMLSCRIESALYKLSGSDPGSGDRENITCQEEVLLSIVLGNNSSGKSLIRLIKLPYVEKIPPYTTWIFLNRNQRMAEDQSVVGRRRIYYDQCGSEALICSDSEEEVAEPVAEKHEFSEGEDQILWKTVEECGLNQEVLNILTQFIEASSSEIQERYDTLVEKNREKTIKNVDSVDEMGSERSIFLDKSLSAALDSFDNLFCRRCLVFDCRLHGCSQNLIIPNEKLSFWYELEENGNPCSDQCYLWGRKDVQDLRLDQSLTNHDPSAISSEAPIVTAGSFDTDTIAMAVPLPENIGKRKGLKHGNMPLGNSKPGDKYFRGYVCKKQKKVLASDGVSEASEGLLGSDLISNDDQLKEVLDESSEYHSMKYIWPGGVTSCENNDNTVENIASNDIEFPVVKLLPSSGKEQNEVALSDHAWNPIEKELYSKGIEIFGKNSCLIARNLLSGLKTCIEVSNYMIADGAAMPQRSTILPNPSMEDNAEPDTDYTEQEMPTRTRFWRRRGRARKLKYTWKSTGHPSIRKRMADGKQQSCKQYMPCGCQLMCGKQCPCLHNGTCCEKYCGCSKSCKNRFRGCHCAKSQCRSRQCPCFAAGRECDPDVCRNCWVSCGGGSLGEPPARGDGYQCGNMKLLLKQQQRILLGKSDVAGWGAFIKKPVNKNDYLGEYTGELISHKEADKRGKIYDRANSSFLFDLNDQYVLDAYRKGDKLKFANHSSNPNCYAKVMLVAGDHRVGIFAKEHIEASEELFYDYRYGPDQAPAWARKPDSSKRDDPSFSYGRAQKIA